MSHDDEHGEVRLLLEVVKLLQQIFLVVLEILQTLQPPQPPAPKLSKIKIQFGGIMPLGPVTLNVGQNTTASVVGFDQNGNQMPADFVMPPVTFAIDNSAIASSAPNPDNATSVVTGVSAGVANLTATVQGPSGPLSDTETVTVLAVPPPPPVLSSIKVSFTTPTP